MKHWSYKKRLKHNNWKPSYCVIPYVLKSSYLSALSKKCLMNKIKIDYINTNTPYRISVNPNDELNWCLLKYKNYSISHSHNDYFEIFGINCSCSSNDSTKLPYISIKNSREIYNDIDFTNLSEEEYFQYSTLINNLDEIIEISKLFKFINESTQNKTTLMNILRGIQYFEDSE